MILDPVREARQRKIIRAWFNAGMIGTAECATGFGKTIMAILAIREVRSVYPEFSVMVVVPTLYLKTQWEERLESFDIDNVEVWVINSAIKHTHFVDLLILDEIHQYTAEVFGQIFDRVSYGQVLGLTATLSENDPRTDLIHERAPVVDTVTMKEALDAGWISPFQVYNLGIELEGEEEINYSKLAKDFNRYFAAFGHDFNLAMKCVTDKNILAQYAKQLNWDEKRLQAAAFQWMKNMRERKDFLYNLDSKHDLAIDVINQFSGRMIITFSQTIESAERIKTALGSRSEVYHSQLKGKKIDGKYVSAKDIKQLAIDRFSSQHHLNTCNVLCTAKAMDQGADLPDIDMVVVISASSTPLQAIQRYGRSLRAAEGKRTIIVEIYAKKTQDEKWLRSRQRKLPKGVVRWIVDLEEIS